MPCCPQIVPLCFSVHEPTRSIGPVIYTIMKSETVIDECSLTELRLEHCNNIWMLCFSSPSYLMAYC